MSNNITVKQMYVGGCLGKQKAEFCLTEHKKNAFKDVLPDHQFVAHIATPVMIDKIRRINDGSRISGIVINEGDKSNEFTFATGNGLGTNSDNNIFPTDISAAENAKLKNKLVRDRSRAAIEAWAEIERAITDADRINDAVIAAAKAREEDNITIVIPV